MPLAAAVVVSMVVLLITFLEHEWNLQLDHAVVIVFLMKENWNTPSILL
jgi:hypothetical protein